MQTCILTPFFFCILLEIPERPEFLTVVHAGMLFRMVTARIRLCIKSICRRVYILVTGCIYMCLYLSDRRGYLFDKQ